MQTYRLLPEQVMGSDLNRQHHLSQQATAMLKNQGVPPSIVVDLLPPGYQATLATQQPQDNSPLSSPNKEDVKRKS